jgi:hypothetical protein
MFLDGDKKALQAYHSGVEPVRRRVIFSNGSDWRKIGHLMTNRANQEIAKVAKTAMPRGSKPGERRGGRQKGTPNRATTAKVAALNSASADPDATPLSFLLSVMRDASVSTDLRISVAKTAARLVHGKGNTAPVQSRNAAVGSEPDGFTIGIVEAKALRDLEHRLAVLLRKRYEPGEYGGLLTVAEIAEEAELDVMFRKRAAALGCPPDYGPLDAVRDSDRLHQLNCKRLSPPSCGGGELKGADDEEEAFLTARVAAFRHSPEGRDRNRITELEAFRLSRNGDEQAELDRLSIKYPNGPESELTKAIKLRAAELRQRSE